MEWSWLTFAISGAAVVASGAIAWHEGNWRRQPGLGMGFADHGGMWSDLILLPFANAAIVPWLTAGAWLIGALAAAAVASALVHAHWYHAPDWEGDIHGRGNHMWPAYRRGTWWADLSWSGRAHVLYVIGELALLAGFLIHDLPPDVVMLVTIIFTIHLPIGLLQPRYVLTGHIATIGEQPLLAPCLVVLWIVAAVKLQS